MSRRSRRSWGKRKLSHETKARIQKVEELAEAGYGPRAIAPAAKLPPQLIEEMLALNHRTTGGEGGGVSVE
jgi:hypothetical protein